VVLKVVAEAITKNKTTNGIAVPISAVRVKLSSPEKDRK
jgi:hypothetical protein